VSPIRSNRSALAFLGLVFSTNLGMAVQVTALGKQVFDLTHRDLDLGILGLLEFLPAFLLVTVAGAVADRRSRRHVAILGILAEGACTLALWQVISGQPTGVGTIFAIVLCFGIVRAFVAPATRSLPANIVDPATLPRLIALNSTMWQTSAILGPVMAGYLYTVDPAAPYLVATICYGIGACGALLIRVRPQQRPVAVPPRGWSSAFEGLRHLRTNRILLGAISLDLFAVLFGGAYALLPALAERQFGVDSTGLGWLRAAAGIGATATAITMAVRPIRSHIGAILFTAVAIFGVGTVVLAGTHSFAVAFIALIVLSAADAVSVFIRATLGPLVTPDAVRGRVLAVENVFIGASNELGAFESGVAGQLLGTAPAVALGGIATLAVAAIWSRLFPELRTIDTFPEQAA
jgi:MFS family permease